MSTPAVVTFDCYDTLVEFPIDAVTRQILGERAHDIAVEGFLESFEDIRFQAALGPYLPYHELLRQSLAQAMEEFGIAYDDADGDTLVAAISTFGPFPDVPPALRALRERGGCKLVIITNSDDAIIAENVRRIGVPFDEVITAERARAYKPSPAIFDYALRHLNLTPEEHVHVAQGFNYDIMPAHDMGWQRVWINRYGKTGDPAYGPYHELPDLAGLPRLLGVET